MYQKTRPINLDRVNHQTNMGQEQLKTYRNIVEDSERRERLKKQECPLCFYESRIGGQAITQTECSICGKEMTHGNTNIDCLCKECAKDKRLCKHCGSDIDLKHRRKI